MCLRVCSGTNNSGTGGPSPPDPLPHDSFYKTIFVMRGTPPQTPVTLRGCMLLVAHAPVGVSITPAGGYWSYADRSPRDSCDTRRVNLWLATHRHGLLPLLPNRPKAGQLDSE